MRPSPGERRPRLLGPLPGLVCGLAVLLLDQLSKQGAVAHLVEAQPRPLLPGLLQLQLVHNTGAAFSLFTGASGLLGVVSALVCLALVLLLVLQPPQRLSGALAAGLLLGGAAGNGLDRWRLGAVVDFLALVPIDFPVFNLADVAINLAVLLFVIDLLLEQRRDTADRQGRDGADRHG